MAGSLKPAWTQVRLTIHMNLVWLLIEMCFSWLLPAEQLRAFRSLPVSSMNRLAMLALPVRLQLAPVHPPIARPRR